MPKQPDDSFKQTVQPPPVAAKLKIGYKTPILWETQKGYISRAWRHKISAVCLE